MDQILTEAEEIAVTQLIRLDERTSSGPIQANSLKLKVADGNNHCGGTGRAKRSVPANGVMEFSGEVLPRKKPRFRSIVDIYRETEP
ncbi:hypothetical protein OROGR_031348 [Orobanche gracilis]